MVQWLLPDLSVGWHINTEQGFAGQANTELDERQRGELEERQSVERRWPVARRRVELEHLVEEISSSRGASSIAVAAHLRPQSRRTILSRCTFDRSRGK